MTIIGQRYFAEKVIEKSVERWFLFQYDPTGNLAQVRYTAATEEDARAVLAFLDANATIGKPLTIPALPEQVAPNPIIEGNLR